MPYGPCTVCGKTNYPNSMGGPGICPACDCGGTISISTNTGGDTTSLYSDFERLERMILDLKNCLKKSGMCKTCMDKLKCITKDKNEK